MDGLAGFLKRRREEVARRWLTKVKAALRTERVLDDQEILDSLLEFLDEVTAAVSAGADRLPGEGDAIAQAHGAQRQVLQRNIEEVVHEYGLLFEAVIEEAETVARPPFAPREYARLAGCLSAGASLAVQEYVKLRDLDLRRHAWEHFAFLAHEIRNPLQSARMACLLLRGPQPNPGGLAVLERSLNRAAEQIDRALVDSRLRGVEAGNALRREPLDLLALAREAVEGASPDAEVRGIRLSLEGAGPAMVVADSRVLLSALSNLVRNAVKFTRTSGAVRVVVGPGRVEVEDQCGGLRPGDEESIFEAFRQTGQDRSGFGLGLAIAREAASAHGGKLTVANLPGEGCRFTLALPE